MGHLGHGAALGVPNGVPFSLEYYSTFSTNGTLGTDFCDTPVPSVPLSQTPLIYCFTYRLYEQEWDSVLDGVSQCPKLQPFSRKVFAF
jgi:hypothetical protein